MDNVIQFPADTPDVQEMILDGKPEVMLFSFHTVRLF